MELIGEDVTDEELDEMLDLGDIDKDGKIDYGGKAGVCAFLTAQRSKIVLILWISTFTEFAKILA